MYIRCTVYNQNSSRNIRIVPILYKVTNARICKHRSKMYEKTAFTMRVPGRLQWRTDTHMFLCLVGRQMISRHHPTRSSVCCPPSSHFYRWSAVEFDPTRYYYFPATGFSFVALFHYQAFWGKTFAPSWPVFGSSSNSKNVVVVPFAKPTRSSVEVTQISHVHNYIFCNIKSILKKKGGKEVVRDCMRGKVLWWMTQLAIISSVPLYSWHREHFISLICPVSKKVLLQSSSDLSRARPGELPQDRKNVQNYRVQ